MSIRWQLYVGVVIAVLAGTTVAWQVTANRIRDAAAREVRQRSVVLQRALEASVDISLALELGGRSQATRFVQQLIDADHELGFLAVTDRNLKPVVWASRQEFVGDAQLDLAEIDALMSNFHREEPMFPGAVAVRLDLTQETVEAGASERSAVGYVYAGFSVDAQLARLRSMVFFATACVGGGVLLLLWGILFFLFRRIDSLRGHAERLAAGDLTVSVDDSARDEVGTLAQALGAIVRNMGRTIGQVRTASGELALLSERVRKASAQLDTDAGTQTTSVTDTANALRTMTEASTVVDDQLRDVTLAAETGANRLREMSVAVEKVATSLRQLSGAVDTSRGAIVRARDSMKEVDKSVDGLSLAAESTVSAASEITASIRAVEQSTEQALSFSRLANEHVEEGVVAVQANRDAMNAIRTFAENMLETIRSLSEQVGGIESILSVISDIANQTKLLSLNASIIAAQAGEHGRGFLVVAEEIKALAQKTAGSTRAIGALIHEAQARSMQTIAAVEAGLQVVSQGVSRSEHASRVLQDIRDSVSQSSALVRGVSIAMSEQTRGASQVDRAMQDVHATIMRVRSIVKAQEEESMELERAVGRINDIMTSALRTGEEQAQQVAEASVAIRQIFDQIRQVGDVNRRQANSRLQLGAAFELLAQLSERGQANARGLSMVVEQAASQSKQLAEGVRVFKVDESAN